MATMMIPLQMYRVIVHQAEEGGFWGEVIGLPGCVSQGETPEELATNMREAIEAVLSVPVEAPIQLLVPPPLPSADVWVFTGDAREGTVKPGQSGSWTAAV